MATIQLQTVTDLRDHLLDWGPGATTADAITLRKIYRSIESAYREFPAMRKWSYLMSRLRLNTVASQSSSTITYTNSSRTVTLASGSWPSWAAYGTLQIAGVEYEIASRDSSTALTLSVNSNPGADVAAGTSYVIWRDTYPLPIDLVSIGAVKDATNNYFLTMMEPNEWVGARRYSETPTQPRDFAIMADPNYTGSLAIRFLPPPDAIYQYDAVYQRRPRQLSVPQYAYTTGTITTSSTTVTGSGTAWTSAMIGSILRPSNSASVAVTGKDGSNPYVEQRIITAVGSATSATIDQALTTEVSGVKYEISDPIDLEPGAMYSAFLRRCEWELGMLMNRQDQDRLFQRYKAAEILACEMDSRSFDRFASAPHAVQLINDTYTVTNETS